MLILCGWLGFATMSQAAVSDRDMDGLTDTGETDLYHTDPQLFDTDGDGVSDGREIVGSTDPLDSQSSEIAELTKPDPGILGEQARWPWYLARATGLAAFLLLTLGVVYGLVMSSRAFQKLLSGAAVYELHRFFSLAALAAVAMHVGSLFVDDFLKLQWREAFIPGVLHRDYQSALGYDMGMGVGIGIFALYGMFILILTSEFRQRMSLRVWRAIHSLSFVTYGAFVAHGFFTGTDSQALWVRMLYIGSFSLVMVLVVIRIVSRTLLPAWRAARMAPEGE